MNTHPLSATLTARLLMLAAFILTICAGARVFAASGETRAAIAAQSRLSMDGLQRGEASAVAVLLTADAKPAAAAASTAPVTADRVGFPRDYRSALKLLSVAVKDAEPSVMTAYGNGAATSVTASGQLPFPYGTVIAMEFAHGVRDGEGQLLYDAGGIARKAEVARIDVMRRERGYGEMYGDSRAGEWEFASYRPDGTVLVSPENGGSCAACHRKAGAERDFVYRLRVPAN